MSQISSRQQTNTWTLPDNKTVKKRGFISIKEFFLIIHFSLSRVLNIPTCCEKLARNKIEIVIIDHIDPKGPNQGNSPKQL